MSAPDVRASWPDTLAWRLGARPDLRSTVVAVIRLGGAPSWPVLRGRMAAMIAAEPRLRQRLAPVPLHTAPVWREDRSADLDFHLVRLALPVDACKWSDVLELAAEEMMQDFDAGRPPWRVHLVEGLRGGDSALIWAFNHALADGHGALALTRYLVDPAEAPPAPVAAPTAPARRSGLLDLAGATARDMWSVQRFAVAATRSAPGALVSAARSPFGTARALVGDTRSVARMVDPRPRSVSTVFGPRGAARRFATIDVPQPALVPAAHRAAVHVNDAFLASVVEGVRRYHAEQGSSPPHLRVTVPVDLRRRDDPALTNRITLIRLQLPAQITDPARRMVHVAQVVDQWLREPALRWNDGIAAVLDLLPAGWTAGVFRSSDLLASDVHGPPVGFSIAGAPVTGLYPFGPTLGTAVNITLLSLAGRCHVGVTIDATAVSDPDLLLECLEQGFGDTLRVGGHHAGAAAR